MGQFAAAVDAVIGEHIGNERAVFVFPSEMAASAYADRTLAGGGGTLPMERFIAWDSFLEEAVLPGQKNRASISDIMRKMFAAIILNENALCVKKGQPPLFQSIIYPQYAQYAPSFTSWVAGILPQMGIWAEYATGAGIEHIGGGATAAALQNEEKDYRTLIIRYKEFLDDNGLFESAWEKPPFTHNGKQYYLFFTEALADFPLYQALLLAAQPHIVVVRTAELTGAQAAFQTYFLKNAKSEITAAALYIMNLRQSGVEYRDITVTSPGLEIYEPYILDEFAAHGIPVQNGNGKPLSAYPAGRLFSAISECVSKKMAVDAVSSLLLNRSVPWKNEAGIDALITYGLRNNCICSWEEENGAAVDVWERAFEKKPSPLSALYRDLKRSATRLGSSGSFSKIRDHYFAFRGKFIDTEKFQTEPYFEADAVLGRCIAELSRLIQIEKKYPRVKVPSPWQFFMDYLNNTIYKAQSVSDGVHLLSYRVAASIPSACHIVLGATQNAMPQIFREISFLSSVKKRRYHIEDIDASEVFFRLHRFSSRRQAVFFCSEETFTGFALPYNGLDLLDREAQSLASVLAAGKQVFHTSYYQEEMRFFDAAGAPDAETPPKRENIRFFAVQKAGFDAFAARHGDDCGETAPLALHENVQEIKDRIAARYIIKNRLSVSASALLPYYTCSFLWLFKTVYRIEEIDAETTLMSPFARGNIYHDIMRRIFTALKEKNRSLGLTEEGGIPPEMREILAESVENAFLMLPESGESALTEELLQPQKNAVLEKCRLLFEKMLEKFDSCGVAEVEPEPEWEIDGGIFALVGRPDLLLFNPVNSNYIIIDFKSGKLPSKGDCTVVDGDRGIKNFQLPMYRKLAESAGFSPADTGFFSAIKDTKLDQFFYPPAENEKKPAFADIEEDFEYKTRRYVQEVLSADIEESRNEKYGECLRCDYRRICRTTLTVQRENLKAQKRNSNAV
jgi:hypothetical protein